MADSVYDKNSTADRERSLLKRGEKVKAQGKKRILEMGYVRKEETGYMNFSSAGKF